MLVKTYGAAVQGIDALVVTLETVVDRGFSFTMVGLPDAAVKESYQRVVSAISATQGGDKPQPGRCEKGGSGIRPAYCGGYSCRR